MSKRDAVERFSVKEQLFVAYIEALIRPLINAIPILDSWLNQVKRFFFTKDLLNNLIPSKNNYQMEHLLHAKPDNNALIHSQDIKSACRFFAQLWSTKINSLDLSQDF